MKKTNHFSGFLGTFILSFILGLSVTGSVVFASDSGSQEVVYISDSGSDSQIGDSADTAVQTWDKAYELLEDNGTIVVAGNSTAPDSAVALLDKKAMITGIYNGVDYQGTLLPPNGPFYSADFSFGADTVVDNLCIDCSQSTKPESAWFNIYANGHNLTIGENMKTLPFKDNIYTPYPNVFAGGANFFPPVQTEAGNTIVIKSGQYTEVCSNGFTNSLGVDSKIHLSGGVVIDYINYSCEGKDAEYYIINGSEEKPTFIQGIDDYYGYIGKIEVQDGGYLKVSGDDAIMEDTIHELAVLKGGTLQLDGSLTKAITGDFLGGGTIIMNSGEQIKVPGMVTGETMLELIPEQASDKGYIEGIKLGSYISADPSSTGTFQLKNNIDGAIVKSDRQNRVEWELVPAFTITYTDGIEGEEVFPDQIYSGLIFGEKTPQFEGTPIRDGYQFIGWTPEIQKTVENSITYTAQWKHVHTYEETWRSDQSGHWKECTVCHSVSNKDPHSFEWVIDKNATAAEPGFKHEECTICGYAKEKVEVSSTGTTYPKEPNQPDNLTDIQISTPPQTDDNSLMWLLIPIPLLLLSGGICGGLIAWKRKKKIIE